MKSLGTKISELRKARSMTQDELAVKMGVSPQAVSKWENDLSMLEAAGVGIAMGNGLDIAKNAADRITLTNDEDGVADAIERLIFN